MSNSSKILTNALLDKAMMHPDLMTDLELSDQFFMLYGPVAQAWTSTALSARSICPLLSDETNALLNSLALQLDRSARFALAFSNAGQQSEEWNGFIESHILDRIEGLTSEEDDLLVLPTGNQIHAMLTAIRRQENGQFSVTVYNPGFDQEEGCHEVSPEDDSKSYSFITYEDVPWEDLADMENWKALLATRKQNQVKPVYDAISKLCVKGQRLEVKDFYDPKGQLFSRKQEKHSCSFTAVYALCRHQVLTQPGRPVGERLMEWRVTKATLARQLFDRMSNVNSHIQDLALRKVNRLSAELDLLHQAESAEDYCIIMKSLREARGENPGKIENPGNVLGRMRDLREEALATAIYWLENGKPLAKGVEDPLLEPASKIFDYHFDQLTEFADLIAQKKDGYEGLVQEQLYPRYIFRKYPLFLNALLNVYA